MMKSRQRRTSSSIKNETSTVLPLSNPPKTKPPSKLKGNNAFLFGGSGFSSQQHQKRLMRKRRRIQNNRRMLVVGSCVVLVFGTFYILIALWAHSSILSTINHHEKNFYYTNQHQREVLLERRKQLQQEQLLQQANRLIDKNSNFPIHVGRREAGNTQNNFEEIAHPGIVFSGGTLERIQVLMPDVEFPETLIVPKFWNPTIAFETGVEEVRTFLGNYGERLITPQEASKVGNFWISPPPEEEEENKIQPAETIFVSIASYRDTECQPTVESIFARAEYPNRIRVAIIDQIEDEDLKCSQPTVPCDDDPTQVLCKYHHLIDVYEVKAYMMVGPVFARHIAHRMYRGEYFAMQVDAHVRFTHHWDTDIINQWYSTGNEMAVISTYLQDIANSIDPTTHESRRQERNILCKLQYDGTGINSRLVLKAPLNGLPQVKNSPMIHPFWSAGFSFSRGHFIVQVPYDQHLPMLFQGEEAIMALRGFTYGYDYYAPVKSIAYHIYAVKSNSDRRNRHKFWENDTLYLGALEKSTARLNGITGLSGGRNVLEEQDYYHVDEQKYGLGKVRSKEKYFETFGIDTNAQRVDESLCGFVKETMHKEFLKELRPDTMGIDYRNIFVSSSSSKNLRTKQS